MNPVNELVQFLPNFRITSSSDGKLICDVRKHSSSSKDLVKQAMRLLQDCGYNETEKRTIKSDNQLEISLNPIRWNFDCPIFLTWHDLFKKKNKIYSSCALDCFVLEGYEDSNTFNLNVKKYSYTL